MISIILSLLISVTNASEKELIEMIKKGNISSFSSEARLPDILNSDDEILRRYEARQKLLYPRFSIDLLYTMIARDDDYKYEFYFDIGTKRCLMVKNKHAIVRDVRVCDEGLRMCLAEKKGDISNEIYKSCLLKQPKCRSILKLEKPKELDANICEKLYGRKL